MPNRHTSRRIRSRDLMKGGRYYNAQDWYCEGYGTTHSGYRDGRWIEGKQYCDAALYKRMQQKA